MYQFAWLVTLPMLFPYSGCYICRHTIADFLICAFSITFRDQWPLFPPLFVHEFNSKRREGLNTEELPTINERSRIPCFHDMCLYFEGQPLAERLTVWYRGSY